MFGINQVKTSPLIELILVYTGLDKNDIQFRFRKPQCNHCVALNSSAAVQLIFYNYYDHCDASQNLCGIMNLHRI